MYRDTRGIGFRSRLSQCMDLKGGFLFNTLIEFTFSAENNGWLIFDGSLKPTWFLGNATPLEVENIILGDSQDDSADNEEDSDVCSDEVDSSDDSESSLESDYE
ncbi:hypothetical protein EVAR_80789_1 [Eumeta japonica]|uniref:Uncharacterized protein n=1 Tax=Eumeta variegata TaxID=151549 RepID=A0A4C1WDE9_EUMVA|nr:hypothetical protein EVAR_80789_1 [Eumeta japonica]